MKRVEKVTSLVILFAAAEAVAQQGVEQRGEGLEEIIVTAQRREQNLQEVPISLSVFGGEQLERANVKGATDYLLQTPNVSFTEDGQTGARGVNLSIRGINNLVSGENAFVNSVGIYLDEFSIASVPNGVANPFLPDMERVEVLRGPQGTYFGRNSLGGALNLVSRAPTDVFEGQATLGAESYENAGEAFNLTGVLNVPVSDTFKLRLVAFYEDSSGLVENINPSGRDDSGHEWINVRLRGVWEPTDRARLGFTFIYADEDQGTDENVPSGVVDLDTIDTFGFQPGVGFDPGTGFFPRNQNKLSHDLQEFNKLETTVGILNFAYDVAEGMTFKAIAGVIDAEQRRFFDNDLIGGLDILARTNIWEGSSWSIEARLESRSERVDWVVGALYAQDDQEQFNDVAVSNDPTATFNGVGFLPPFPPGLGLSRNTKDFEVDSQAVFADVTYRATDRLDLILGARYTSDDVLNARTSFGIRPTLPPGPGFFQSFINFARPDAAGDRSFSDISPRAGLRFQMTDNANVYATVSKGYKAGGTSTGNNTNQAGSPVFNVPYDEETLWNYEVGIKSELADRRVRVNASVFQLRWKDLQMEAFRFLTPGDLSSNFEQTINIEKAEATGAEIELLARPTQNVTLGGALGYLDSEIKSDTVAEITGGFDVSLKGLVLPKAPELTVNLFAEYSWNAWGGSAWIRGEYLHRDEQYSDIEALTNRQTRGPSPNQGLVRVVPDDEFPYLVPAFDVFNLRAGYFGERTSFSVFVQNVFDEEYYTGTQENFGLSGIRLRPHPRTYGANVTFRF